MTKNKIVQDLEDATGKKARTTLRAEALAGDPAAEARWQRCMKGASDFIEGFKDYAAATQQSHAEAAEAFVVAFDEGGERGSFPNVLLIAMLAEFCGINHARTDPDASRKAKELTLDLAETMGRDELQALYQVVVKATKL